MVRRILKASLALVDRSRTLKRPKARKEELLTRILTMIKKVLPGIALVAMALAMQPMGASAAAPFKFHVHMDSYGKGNGYNCGNSEWSSTLASCGGFGHNGNAGSAGPFNGYDYVGWCNGSPDCAGIIGAKTALPEGYSRWMELCSGADCRDKLIGAVRMPNGPFLVVGGRVDGKDVARQDENKGVETDGGPLFLYVGFNGYINNGGGVPASHGYVFGLRGYIQF